LRRLRIAGFVAVFLPVTLALMGVQWLAIRLDWRLAHTLPVAYHRFVCRLLRLRIRVEGAPAKHRPLLVVANHTSWLDITVLSTMIPVSFIAKSEVGTWPFFGTLARLQRSIFIDRNRRKGAHEANRAVAARLVEGDAIILFAEGTTGDGNSILPFRSAVIGAARDAIAEAGHEAQVLVQPLAIAYPARAGLPLDRAGRPAIAWYGDMDLLPHLADVVAGPAIEAVVAWGDPITFGPATDRKAVARALEDTVREDYRRVLRGR
jgi:1-acyl-sn-glycerol-3-phosphate acyltransferase